MKVDEEGFLDRINKVLEEGLRPGKWILSYYPLMSFMFLLSKVCPLPQSR
jgi:hypothetical protein